MYAGFLSNHIMKIRVYLYIFLFFVTSIFSACKLQQDYTMNYSFSVTSIPNSIFSKSETGFTVAMPVSSQSCDPTSHGARLERRGGVFYIYLDLTAAETECDLRFDAEVNGIESGQFMLEVYKASPEVSSPLLQQEFTI